MSNWIGDKMLNKKTFFGGIILGVVLAIVVNSVYSFATTRIRLPFVREMTVDQKVKSIYSILDNYYVDDYSKEETEEGLYSGLVYSLGDPYTNYLDKSALNSFMSTIEGTYVGIGLVVSVDPEDNQILAVSPYEGSPAMRAGILPGDKITKVNGVAYSGDYLDEAVSIMKGKENTFVTLTIYRQREDRTFDVDVLREKIDIPTVSHKMLENNIGYLRLIGFERVTTGQFVSAYNDLKDNNMQALILDLRNNPGGLLDVAVTIADMLVDNEFIVYTEGKSGDREYYTVSNNNVVTYTDETKSTERDGNDKTKPELPIIVLVNGSSASASEVLSGAIRDTGSGMLVGSQTFGKGLVQNLYFLPDGSGIKVTIAKYYTPSGVCIDGVGIAPDYVVNMSEEDSAHISSLSLEEDTQLEKAIEVAILEMRK